MSLRKDWSDFLISSDEAEELEEAYIVFEEYEPNKTYDVCFGIFKDLQVAKDYAVELNKRANEGDKKYVLIYKDYIEGNYDYLYEQE